MPPALPAARRPRLLLAALAVAAATSPCLGQDRPPRPDAARSGIRPLVGRWRVVHVQVEDAPVQALVRDDPRYMGAVLEITPDLIRWRASPRMRRDEASLSWPCPAPRIDRTVIRCTGLKGRGPDNRFGFAVRPGRQLTIEWYDGGTLVLDRVPGGRRR